jgi:hypothetical protein
MAFGASHTAALLIPLAALLLATTAEAAGKPHIIHIIADVRRRTRKELRDIKRERED